MSDKNPTPLSYDLRRSLPSGKVIPPKKPMKAHTPEDLISNAFAHWGLTVNFGEDGQPEVSMSPEVKEEWISVNPPGQPSAADTLTQIELDRRDRALKKKEKTLDEREGSLKRMKEALDLLQADLLRRQAELNKKAMQLGVAEQMLNSMTEDEEET